MLLFSRQGQPNLPLSAIATEIRHHRDQRPGWVTRQHV